MKEDMQLAIAISNAAPDGITELEKAAKEKGVHFFEKDEHLFLYPIDQDLIEEAGYDLGTADTRFELVWVDPQSHIVKESNLSEKIDKVDFFNKTFQLFDLPDILTFIENNNELIEQEKKSISGEVSEPTLNDPVQTSISDIQDDEDINIDIPTSFEDEEDTDDTSKTESEKVDNEIVDESKKEVPQNTIPTEENDNDDDPFSLEDLSKGFEDEEDVEETSDPPNMEDPLMQAAIEIFNKNTIGDVLPEFDTQTKNLINSDIIEAQDKVNTAKKQAIDSIYQSLKSNHDKELDQALETEIAQAKQSHEGNISQIKQNQDAEIDKIADEEKKAYEDKKNKAGQAALQDFYRKYDAEHLDELNNIIASKSEVVKKNTKSEIEIENQNLDDYIEKVKKSIFNHVTENPEIDNILDSFRQVLDNQKQRLLKEIKHVKTENTDLKKKVTSLKNAVEISKQTVDARVSAEVAEKVNQQTHKYKLQVEDADNKRKSAENTANDWRQQYIEQKAKNDTMLEKINSLNERITNMQDVQRFAPMQQPVAQPTQPQVPSQPQATDIVTRKSENNNHPNKWIKILGIAALVVVSVGFTGTTTALIMNNHQSTAQQTPTVTQTDNGSSSESSDSTPNTFTYTTKDGKKYVVTKDDDHSGHYTDDKGVTHTVIFNQK